MSYFKRVAKPPLGRGTTDLKSHVTIGEPYAACVTPGVRPFIVPSSATVLRESSDASCSRLSGSSSAARSLWGGMAAVSSSYSTAQSSSGAELCRLVSGAGIDAITKRYCEPFEIEANSLFFDLSCRDPRPASLRYLSVPLRLPSRDEIVIPKHPMVFSSICFSEISRDNVGFVLLDITRQGLQAICDLHSLGISHRDIKPDNVAFDHRAGVLRLFDFGCSARLGSRAAKAGAPYYKSDSLQSDDRGMCAVEVAEDYFAFTRMIIDVIDSLLKTVPTLSSLKVCLSRIQSRCAPGNDVSDYDVVTLFDHQFGGIQDKFYFAARRFWETQSGMSQSEKLSAHVDSRKRAYSESGSESEESDAEGAMVRRILAANKVNVQVEKSPTKKPKK